MGLWDTKEQRLQLLTELVAIPSVTNSQAEFDFPYAVVEKLNQLSYFQNSPEHLRLHPVGDGRQVLTALAKRSPETRNTVILVSHFDVVDVQDYGNLRDDAFRSDTLTARFCADPDLLPADVKSEIATGTWVFGRGTMDMKCGLVLHMSILEQACNGAFDGNVLLLAVPDEEVNSIGMRTAVPCLRELAQEHNLDYKLLLNSEPMFGRYPGDKENYIYTGSIGKVLPGFLCYGKETHVGEPWSGLNGNYMASMMTTELELNWDLCEQVDSELTPPPTNLIQKGLKDDYSAQIPHRAVTLFNMFLYRRSMREVVDLLLQSTSRVAAKIEAECRVKAADFTNFYGIEKGDVTVQVFPYEELYRYAVETYGEDEVTRTLQNALYNYDNRDERDRTIQLVNHLATLCRELAPMIVLFFAPPFYPAVDTADRKIVSRLVSNLTVHAKEAYGMVLKQQHYFGGISDLSFVGLHHPLETLTPFTNNTPLWPESYVLPLEDMSQFDVPVLNLGPIGRDAHKWTERLEVDFSLGTLHELLVRCIDDAFDAQQAL